MPIAPGARLGPYEILAPLGAGGMGEVYRARDARLGRDVAIKVLPDAFTGDAERLARFEREARLISQLNHPNICALYHISDAPNPQSPIPNPDQVRFLVLELVDGPTLADMIANGPMPLEEALPIARQISAALEAAHEHGIIHRDLKPANIKLTTDGTVKVLDFGLAKAAENPSDSGSHAPVLSQSPTITSPAMTMGGVILGTAAYMSPEQAKGKPVDKRTDIWAFGCVLFEMLTGKRAFEGEDVSDTLAAILRGDPDWAALPRDTPPAITSLIRRCLEKDRRVRVGDIAAARFVLGDLATPPTAVTAEHPSRRRRKSLIAAAAGVLFAAATAGLAALFYLRAPAATVEPTRRLAVAIPNGSVVSHFALSPDGKRLALVLIRENARAQIWVRPLDSTELQPLAGTFGARDPFWSPDSRSIGFFADGKLKTVSANGGPPQELCQGIGLGGGGAWNDERVILVGAPAGGGGLRRASADGGPCTEMKVTGGRARYPHFLPDGRHFLYVVMAADSAQPGVYVADLETMAGRRLMTDVSSAVYSPSLPDRFNGHLLFLRGSNLTAVPFDARSLQIGGDAFLVANQGSTSFSTPQIAADVSTDGLLAYVANRVETTRFAWMDDKGNEISTVGSVGAQSGVQLSPDNQALAFTRGPAGWLRDLRRNVESPLTSKTAPIWPPVWSPDSRYLSYGRPNSGQIFIREVATGKDESISFDSNMARNPSHWSRDGSVLLYTESNPKTQSDIWALIDFSNASSRRPVPFLSTGSGESQGQMSPNGRWVAYASDESGEWAVYIKGFPDGPVTRVSPAEGREPRWSVDGRELYYLSGVTGRHTLNAAAVDTSSSELRLGDTQPLFPFRGRSFVPQSNIFQYGVSAEKRRFLVNVLSSDAEPTLNIITNWRALIPRN